MTNKKAIFLNAAAGCISLLGACASSPQRQAELQIQDHFDIPAQWHNKDQPTENIQGQLLTLFQDPQLKSIVERAIQNNLDIKLAEKQFEEAKLHADISSSSLFPSISAQLATNRSKDSTGNISRSYNTSLDVAWEVDLWGKIRDRQTSSKSTAIASAYELERIKYSISAQTMQAWFHLISANELLKTEQDRLSNLTLIEESIKQRYLAGLGALNDLDSAKRNASQAHSSVLLNQDATLRAQRQIKILLGEYPHALPIDLPSLPRLIAHLPSGVPANIIANRPDLQAAWHHLNAADANTQASYKSMFPSINLTQSLGKQSQDFSRLMDSPSIWGLANTLSMPLFNAGSLRKNYQASQIKTEQAQINYLSTVLKAYQEVENALALESNLAEREKALDQAYFYAQRSYKHAKEQYLSGSSTILDLLNTQLAVYDAKNELTTIRNERLQNRITLGLALGYGI